MNNEIFDKLRQLPDSFFKRYGIAKLFLFGSYLNGDTTEESDIDLLIEYDPKIKRTLFDRIILKDELEKYLNKKVDLLSKDGILNSKNELRKKEILSNNLLIYAT